MLSSIKPSQSLINKVDIKIFVDSVTIVILLEVRISLLLCMKNIKVCVRIINEYHKQTTSYFEGAFIIRIRPDCTVGILPQD